MEDIQVMLNSKSFTVFIPWPVDFSFTHTLSCGSSSSRREIIPAIRQKVYHDYKIYAKKETNLGKNIWELEKLSIFLKGDFTRGIIIFFQIVQVYISKFKN